MYPNSSKLKYTSKRLAALAPEFSKTSAQLTIPVLLAVIAATGPIVTAINQSDLQLLAFWGIVFLTVIIGGILYFWRKNALEKKFEVWRPFQGIVSADKLTKPWDRPEEEELKQKILNNNENSDQPVIVVGDSGAGKSVLLQNKTQNSFREMGWKVHYVKHYNAPQLNISKFLKYHSPKFNSESFCNDPKAKLENINSATPVLIIFDQFEQFLIKEDEKKLKPVGPDTGKKDNINDLDWFFNFVSNAIKLKNIRIVIAIRKEWYYDMRFLEHLVPAPHKVTHLRGIDLKFLDSGTAINEAAAKLQNIVNNDNVRKKIISEIIRSDGTVLPAELQVIGLVLQNTKADLGSIDEKIYDCHIINKSNLIKRYFASFIDNSTNPQIARKILFALSAKTELRRHLDIKTIAGICHERREDINRCLSQLIEYGLVTADADDETSCDPRGAKPDKNAENNKFELAHDFLAEQYREISGTDLDPMERDNIIYYTDAFKQRCPDITEHQSNMLTWQDWVFFLPVIFIFTLRLGMNLPGQNPDNWIFLRSLKGQFPSSASWSTTLLLPVFTVHLLWAYFVRDFYHKFLSTHEKGILDKSITLLYRLVGFICNVLTAIFPIKWLMFIGIGGVAIGVKYLQLAFKYRSCKITRDFFIGMGAPTVCNMFQFAIFGWVLSAFLTSYQPADAAFTIYAFISLAVALLMIGLELALYPTMSSATAASIMQGLCDRNK
ncbi:MAG: hypothetical protein AB1650_04145 [Candidatus Omnitrophota bacterium]